MFAPSSPALLASDPHVDCSMLVLSLGAQQVLVVTLGSFLHVSTRERQLGALTAALFLLRFLYPVACLRQTEACISASACLFLHPFSSFSDTAGVLR